MKNIKNIVTAIAVLSSVSTTGIASTEDTDVYSLKFTIVNNLNPYSKDSEKKVNLYFERVSDGNCFTSTRPQVKLKKGDSKSITVQCKKEEGSYSLAFNYNTFPKGHGYTVLTVSLSPVESKVTKIDGFNLSSVNNRETLTSGMTIEFNNRM